jgi:hypothetical protein
MFSSFSISAFLVNLGTALVLWLLFSYSNQYVTEFIKNVSRALLSRVPWLGNIVSSKYYGYVVAAALAFWAANNFGVDFLSYFRTLENLDPTVLMIINTVLMALGANGVNDGRITLQAPPRRASS